MVKVHFDKITGNPPYGLTEAELLCVLAAAPCEWVEDVSMVRFSNALHPSDRTWFGRPDRTLTIYSRDRTRKNVIYEILTELAAYHLGFKSRRFQQIAEPRLHRINRLVEPLTEEILATFPKPRPNPVYPRPVRAPYEQIRNA